MFACPLPTISQVMMKWCRRATQLGRFTLWHYGRLASQLAGNFACGTTDAELNLTTRFDACTRSSTDFPKKNMKA